MNSFSVIQAPGDSTHLCAEKGCCSRGVIIVQVNNDIRISNIRLCYAHAEQLAELIRTYIIPDYVQEQSRREQLRR